MADRQPHQLQVHPQTRSGGGGIKTLMPQQGPSAGKVLATITGVPVGGTLLTLSGLALAASVIGLMVATPVFIILSPVIVPAAIVVGMAVVLFLAAHTMGTAGMWLLCSVVSGVRSAVAGTEDLDHYAKRRMQEMTGYVGQKVESKTHEGTGRT